MSDTKVNKKSTLKKNEEGNAKKPKGKVSFQSALLETEQLEKVSKETKSENVQMVEDQASNLKTQLACPSQLLQSLKLQTSLSEHQINVRYMMFRSQYPTGFVGPNVLRELCEHFLTEEDCDEYVDMIFQLYGHKKKGWGCKLIGFREVVLATEGIQKMHKPDEILRWIFRVHDTTARGEIVVQRIESMINSLLR